MSPIDKYPNKGARTFRELLGPDRGAQAEAARRLDVTPDMVCRILAEERRPGLKIALKIQSEYGIAPELWNTPPEQGAA